MPDGSNGALTKEQAEAALGGEIVRDEPAAGGAPGDFSLTMDQVAKVVQQAAQEGIVGIPPSVQMLVGRHVIGEAMAQDAVERARQQIEDLRKEREVMATDMAVLHSRLQEAGLEEAPSPEGAEVAPASPFPGEPGGEAGGGEGDDAPAP
jgi:hypothetical protein